MTKALIDGPATPVLLAQSYRASLLVLGDRGLGGVSGLIIGSVAVHSAAHAGCPVLVVRGTDHPDGPVVVGVDGSETSDVAVGLAFDEAAFRQAVLVPVLAWNDPRPDDDARRTLRDAVAGWQQRRPGVVVEPELVRGHPKQVLVDRSTSAQLVVLGARGRDTFAGLVLGSISQTLLYHSACPVAIARATLSQPPPDDLF